jgi:hypothetical protein
LMEVGLGPFDEGISILSYRAGCACRTELSAQRS